MPRTLRPRKAPRVRAPQSDSEESSADEFTPAPTSTNALNTNAAKKTNATRRGRTVRGKRGGLDKLTAMPLDVVFEILCYLHPGDLLNLARTSKDFRELLMSRRSMSFWKAARQNVEDLPPCPEDMSEPAYANLLFRTNCYHCSRAGCDQIYWDCRARYCKNCSRAVKTTVDAPYDLATAFPKLSIESPLCLIPLYYLCPLMSQEVEKRWAHPFPGSDITIRRVDKDRLARELSKVKPEGMYAFIKAKTDRMKAARELLDMASEWHDECARKREDEKEDKVKSRRDSIKEKLTALGYGKEFESYHWVQTVFNRNPLVTQSRPLTDRIWKNIEPKLLELMETTKHDRLRVSRYHVIHPRLKVLEDAVTAVQPRRTGEPSLYEIAVDIPEVRSILDAPETTKITVADFDFLKTELPLFAQKWHAEARTYLEGLVTEALKKAKIKVKAGTNVLALVAGGIFKCTHCGHLWRYPAVLSHRCNERKRLEKPLPKRDYYVELLGSKLGAARWRAEGYEAQDMSIAAAVLKTAGLDLRTTTVAQADASPARFRCVKHDQEHTVTVRTWLDMLRHCATDKRQHGDTFDLAWYTAVSDAHCALAKPFEQHSLQRDREYSAAWYCAHCTKSPTPTNKPSRLAHVRYEHMIKTPGDDDLVYVGPKGPWAFSGSVTLIDETIRDEPAGKRYKYQFKVDEGTNGFVKLAS